jgi:hypothetical protein
MGGCYDKKGGKREAGVGTTVQLLCSCAAVVVWVLFGGGVMHELEFKREQARVLEYCEGKQTLIEYYRGDSLIVDKLETAVVGVGICRAPHCPSDGDLADAKFKRNLNWSFAGASFFCFTVITTIGYGNYVPVTVGGRVFIIFYALPGFVLHLFALNNFNKVLDQRLFGHIENSVSIRVRVAVDFVVFVVWLCVMAAVYGLAEGWAFGDAFYFSYITSTSIGLGDFAPVQTRDWPLSYILIFMACVLWAKFLAAFIHMFHNSVVHHATVNLDEKIINEKSWFAQLIKHYLHNWKVQLVILWAIILCYMFAGAAIFRKIEVEGLGSSSATGATLSAFSAVSGGASDFTQYIKSSLGNATHTLRSDSSKVQVISEQWSSLKVLINRQGTCPTPLKKEEQWAILNAAIFCMTLFSGIGYGNIVPTTSGGKVFCILYSLVGFVLYTKVQTVTIMWLNKGLNRRVDGMGSCRQRCCSRELEYFRLGVGMGIFFLLFSSVCFTATEDWTFFEAFWFAFISTW